MPWLYSLTTKTNPSNSAIFAANALPCSFGASAPGAPSHTGRLYAAMSTISYSASPRLSASALIHSAAWMLMRLGRMLEVTIAILVNVAPEELGVKYVMAGRYFCADMECNYLHLQLI